MEKALNVLHRMMREAAGAGTTRMPPVREMAKLAGVSPTTMERAVSSLLAQGILTKTNARTVSLAHAPDAEHPPSSRPHTPLHIEQSLTRRISRDILTGRYKTGMLLPTMKELCHTYGSSYRTVKQALEQLSETRLVEVYRKGYRVRGLHETETRTSSIILIVRGAGKYGFEHATPAMNDFVRCLEQECAHANVELRMVIYSFIGSSLVPDPPLSDVVESVLRKGRLLGFVMYDRGMRKQSGLSILAQATKYGCPLALFAENTYTEGERAGLSGAGVRFFVNPSDHAVGRAIAQSLIARGHTRVCYLSPLHGQTWSRHRLRGLRDAFREHGLPRGVQAFITEAGAPKRSGRPYVASIHARLQDLLGRLDIRNDEDRVIVDSIAELKGHIARRSADALLRSALMPLCRQALAQPRCTAWVLPNDTVALECALWLSHQKDPRISDIELIAAEDARELTLVGVSAYSHNLSGPAHACLATVLHAPLHERKAPLHEPLTIDGHVIVRTRQTPMPGRDL